MSDKVPWALSIARKPYVVGEVEWNGAIHCSTEDSDSIFYMDADRRKLDTDEWRSLEAPEMIVEELDHSDPRKNLIFYNGEPYVERLDINSSHVVYHQEMERTVPGRNNPFVKVVDEFKESHPGFVEWDRLIADTGPESYRIPSFSKTEELTFDENEKEFKELTDSLATDVYMKNRRGVEKILDYRQKVSEVAFDYITTAAPDISEKFLQADRTFD